MWGLLGSIIVEKGDRDILSLLFKNIEILILKYKTLFSQLIQNVNLYGTYIMCQSLCLILKKDGEKIDTGKPVKVVTIQWDLFLIGISTHCRMIQKGRQN